MKAALADHKAGQSLSGAAFSAGGHESDLSKELCVIKANNVHIYSKI